MISRRPRADRPATVALSVSGLLVVATMVWYVGGWGSDDVRAVAADAVYVPIALIFTGLGLRIAWHREQDPRARLAWQFIAVSYACQLVAHTSWFVEDAILHRTAYPAVADYWFLIFVPFMLTGLLLLPGERRTTRDRVKLLLAAAVGLYVVADVYYAWIQLHDGFIGGTWPDLFRLSGCCLFGLAAHRRHRELSGLAVTDPLTGLANRATITERLARLTREPLREGKHTAVVMIDLDQFKPINDRYGREAGDAVLLEVASALRGVIRAGDTAGRLGDDEFAVIMNNLPAPGAAESIAKRLAEALRTPMIFDDQLLAVEASIGVAVRDEESIAGEVLLQHADIATASAKRNSGFAVYSAELDTRARDADLRRGIEAGEGSST